MADQLLLVFQAVFLVLLYLFIWWVLRTSSRDLRVPQESFILSPAQLAGTPLARPVLSLVVEESPSLEQGRVVPVGPAPLTVGRLEDNGLPLAGDEFASGHHARVESLRDGLWVYDLDSRNGVYVNGARIEGRAQLRQGDVLQVGGTTLRVAG